MVWAVANSNLALVKYWGKAPGGANHPAGPSLSVTLDGLSTAAGVEPASRLGRDHAEGLPEDASSRVCDFLVAARSRLGLAEPVRVRLCSNFPVAAGLASSASTFAALTVALAAAAGREASVDDLADLARLGSGSACRSLHAGFVEWIPRGDGSRVAPVAPPIHWPLAILVAVVSEERKRVGSREGMQRTAATSPYYPAWLEAGGADLESVREAIRARDLTALGGHVERNCMRMHAAGLAADPPLLYWEPATIAVMREVWRLRERGVEAYFSIDAGPQVKVLCEATSADAVAAAVAAVPGVRRILRSRPGGAPEVLDRPPPWVVAAESAAGGTRVS